MKIALAQLNYHIGNFEANTDKIIQCINKAKQQACDLIVFSELSICGYPPRDFLEFDDFILRCENSLQIIAQHAENIAIIVGSPSKNPVIKGKNLFNSAVFMAEKQIKARIHKSLLPNYDVFDEYRYFEPNNIFEVVPFNGKKLAITICEDIWNIVDDPMYVINPVEELAKQSPDLIINIAASPFHVNQKEIRHDILRKNAQTYQIPIVYVNQVGAQTELIFDGGSLVMNKHGNVVLSLAEFEEDIKIIDIDHIDDTTSDAKFILSNEQAKLIKAERIFKALVLGIKDYFSKLGFSKAILGLSGGIDSAITLVLAVEALGKENVLPVMLPSHYSSEHSITDSVDLCENLNVKYEIIRIDEAYMTITNLLQPFFKDLPFNVTEENIQARIRGILLMALSNKFGYILLNTTNKSEAAVGYGTLYGDLCGGLAVLGDVYKTEIYQLAHFINRTKTIIPENIIHKAPSAELRPNQKDSDSLPNYNILDEILFQYIEKLQGPEELIQKGFDKSLVQKVLKLVNTSEYKRHQAPPILRISPKAFGSGRRMPMVGKYLS